MEIVQYFREIQICILEQSLENPPGEKCQRPEKDYINNSTDIFMWLFSQSFLAELNDTL